MTPLRGLCIGAGYFSQFHFDAWQRIPEVDIVGVCDVDLSRAEAAAKQHGIDGVFTEVTQALDETRPDFVDIITRPDTHLPLVETVSLRGSDIICQKPLADDFATAQRIVETAGSANVRFMVHENFRFQPWYREIRSLLDDGTIGSTLHSVSFRMRTGDGSGPDAYLGRQPYFRDMPRLLLHETGVHFVDTFRFLAGEVERINAVLRRLNPVIAGEDAALLTFEFSNGAIGTWDANRCNEATAADPRYTFGTLVVEADKGSIRLDEEGRLFVMPLGDTEVEHEYKHERRGFAGDCVYFTQRHFIDCLRSGAAFETSGTEYLKTLALVEAAYASAGPVANVSGFGRPESTGDIHRVSLRPDTTSSPSRRIIDLSQPVENGMRGVEISTATTIADKGWNSTTLSLYSHCGTHMDAPKHFLGDDGATIDQQPLAICCGPAKVVDLTPVEPRELITVEHLMPRVESVEAGDRLLLRTGWSHRLGTDSYRDELPRISVALARWLVEQQVALIGVEAPSVADVLDLAELTEVHQTLFRGDVVIVEGLVNLDQLRQPVIEFIALPLRITGGDGCPVRAIAIEETYE